MIRAIRVDLRPVGAMQVVVPLRNKPVEIILFTLGLFFLIILVGLSVDVINVHGYTEGVKLYGGLLFVILRVLREICHGVSAWRGVDLGVCVMLIVAVIRRVIIGM